MTLEETIADLQRERDEFARRAKESEDIRAAMFETTRQVGVDMSKTLENMQTLREGLVAAGIELDRALEEIEQLQKIADAAVKWRQSADLSAIGEHLNAARELRAQVDAHLLRVGSRS